MCLINQGVYPQDNHIDVNIARLANELAAQFDTSETAILVSLGIHPDALLPKKTKCDLDISKNGSYCRLLQLQQLMSLAISYFGTQHNARHWFDQINIGLGQRSPISLCSTSLGMDKIENSIQRLMHGMTA
jgi:putative toxin-antitoxin system antitoxin component (TIGR02293 family)